MGRVMLVCSAKAAGNAAIINRKDPNSGTALAVNISSDPVNGTFFDYIINSMTFWPLYCPSH
jgi:hypothetical protein